MTTKNYYTSGELMKIAHISKKTIRYYDEHNILKPTYVSDRGFRYYTEEDLAKLQQILLLKHLGFSLDTIREINLNESDPNYMNTTLSLQLKLVEERLEQLETIKTSLQDTMSALSSHQKVDWIQTIHLVNTMGMENSLKKQYKTQANVSSRINLHSLYSTNKTGWFPWIYSKIPQLNKSTILEIGCGNGQLWLDNQEKLPTDSSIILSDISEGMLSDAKRNLKGKHTNMTFLPFDGAHIPYPNESFDLVLCNHVLFYCDELDETLKEIHRVLKKGGTFLCSTYGISHMKEIRSLVHDFDSRIVLSADELYLKFGKENGRDILSSYFDSPTFFTYEDSLHITSSDDLISYILSCHGNQSQYILPKYKEFYHHVSLKTKPGFDVTKDAGIFISRK